MEKSVNKLNKSKANSMLNKEKIKVSLKIEEQDKVIYYYFKQCIGTPSLNNGNKSLPLVIPK